MRIDGAVLYLIHVIRLFLRSYCFRAKRSRVGTMLPIPGVRATVARCASSMMN